MVAPYIKGKKKKENPFPFLIWSRTWKKKEETEASEKEISPQKSLDI